MPETYSTPAIALMRRAWREEDSLVDVYTLERGKLQLLVRGGRRLSSRLSSHLEPLTLLEVMVIAGRNRPAAAAASSRSVYPALKSDFDKLAATGWAINRFNRLVKEGERDEKLFHLLSDFLALLNEAEAPAEWYEWFAKLFLLQVLSQLGYAPSSEQFRKDTALESAAELERLNRASLYEAAQATFSKTIFHETDRWLDRWLPAAIEDAL